jgi:hypothetical protein
MRRLLWAALGISGLTSACDKADAPTATIDPAATATATTAASDAGEDSSAPPHVDAEAPAVPLDGGPSATEAPLAYWMRDHAGTAMQEKDLFALAAAFDRIATFAPKVPPPAYANWASIAKDGAAAARAASLDGVKGACRGCHVQYRNAYKGEMRARPLS